MKLVKDWKECWKWFSVHCMVVATAVQGAWMFIPADLKSNLPTELAVILTLALLVLGLIGRLVDQK